MRRQTKEVRGMRARALSLLGEAPMAQLWTTWGQQDGRNCRYWRCVMKNTEQLLTLARYFNLGVLHKRPVTAGS